jgi:AcrR family transcriptional regulator
MANDQAAGQNGSPRSSKRAAILRQAQKLFADFGYHAVSIRDIAAATSVPPTLVLYHFSSKEKLYEAVFEDVAQRLNQPRQQKLLQFTARGSSPGIEAILDALARPLIEMRRSAQGAAYARLIAREASDPSEEARGIIARTLDPSARQFLKLMVDALPGVPEPQVHWAFHYFIACLIAICANTGRIRRLSKNLCPADDAEAVIRQLVAFFVRSLDAAPPPKKGARAKGRTKRR